VKTFLNNTVEVVAKAGKAIATAIKDAGEKIFGGEKKSPTPN